MILRVLISTALYVTFIAFVVLTLPSFAVIIVEPAAIGAILPFWSTVANPMALAQWDSDGDAIDPFTGEKTHHVKGELKTNAEGYNYFEYLNGSSPVGRQVLKDTDILTRDGSWWNHYDFMDCDDKKKSTIGTIVKDALPIALFAIPYVNTAYISASLINSSVSFLAFNFTSSAVS